jgi:hypothetical protein
MAGKSTKPQIAKVDTYEPRPLKDALAKDADAPREQVDQIEDYHKKHPTLDTSGPEHDPEVQAELAHKVAEKTPAPQEPQEAPKG